MSNSGLDKKFPPKTEKDELFDAVFGPDEEISQEAAEDIMQSHGVTGEQLVENLKGHLQERIKRVRDETGAIPNTLVAMLNNIREYQKEKVPKAVGADEWIAELFNPTSMPTTHAQPLFNLRNRATGEVSENDRRILNEITAELEE